MKNTVIITVILCLCGTLFSQTQSSTQVPSREFSLKLNSSISANFESVLTYETSPIIPGIRLQTSGGNIHQLELLHLFGNIKEVLPGNAIDGFAFGVRYEYAWALKQSNVSRWKPYLGFGVLESFSSWITQPEQSSFFSQRDRDNLIRLSIVPSIQYEFGEKFFVDFALPISFFDYQTEENLTRSAPLGGMLDFVKNKQASFYLIKDLGLRFGIGLRL